MSSVKSYSSPVYITARPIDPSTQCASLSDGQMDGQNIPLPRLADLTRPFQLTGDQLKFAFSEINTFRKWLTHFLLGGMSDDEVKLALKSHVERTNQHLEVMRDEITSIFDRR